MFVYQRPITKCERYWNHFCIIELLLIATIDIVYAMNILQSNTSNISCLHFENCKSCAFNEKCSWSLNLQTCGNQIEKYRNNDTGYSNLLLSNSSNCPLLKKKDKPYTAKTSKSNYEYQVHVLTNNLDFRKFLQKSIKSCLIQSLSMGFPYSYQCYLSNPEIMVCMIHNLTLLNVGTYHVNLLMNGTYLKYDNDKDYFFTIYDSSPSREEEQCEPCIFRDNLYRYYIGCHLSNNRHKLFYDRQLIDRKMTNNISTNITTEMNCPNVKIESIKPLIGPSAGGTSVNITVRSIGKYLNNSVIHKVYIGEYECKSFQPIRNETITCITSSIKEGYVGSYNSSVTVHYNDYLILKSNQMIYKYERSQVTSVTPNWGFMNDSILLIISGKYLNVDDTVNVTIGDNQVACNITENNLNCPISCNNTNITGKVNVEIDNTIITDDKSSFYFTCFEKPAVTPYLKLESIVSGNTSLKIIGSHFSSMYETYFTVVDHNKLINRTKCVYNNNTLVVCKSPDLHSVHANSSGTVLNFVITVKLRGVDDFVDLESNFSEFTLFPDPVITSFEVENDGIVVINGVDLDRGYEPEDVNIRFTDSVGFCNDMISRTRHFIKCKLTSKLYVGSISDINIKIGDKSMTVNKKVYNTKIQTTITSQTEENFSTVSTKNAVEPSNIEISFSELSILVIIALCISFILLSLLLSCNLNKSSNVKKLKTNNSVMYMKDIKPTFEPLPEPIELQY